MGEQLKPCPFCGKIPDAGFVMTTINPDTMKWAGCPNPDCVIGWDDDDPMKTYYSLDQWNTRPLEDALQEQLRIAIESNKNGVREWEVVKGERDALQRKLDIAVEALDRTLEYVNSAIIPSNSAIRDVIGKALKQLEKG